MPTVAQQLREAREAKKLEITQVAEITKIRGDHLRALEDGNYKAFSAPVYIKGFVRTYSTLLKLDVPQVMQALDAELSQTKDFREPPSLSSQRRGLADWVTLWLSKLDLRKTLIVLSVLLIAGIAAGSWYLWRHHKASDPLAGLKPGIYQPGSKAVGETLPVPNPSPAPAQPKH
jgi:cytoskeletal protein RodZ